MNITALYCFVVYIAMETLIKQEKQLIYYQWEKHILQQGEDIV